MNLGIVGHGQEKFTEETEEAAREICRKAIAFHRPEYVVSGHSPLGGVDIYAEEEAEGLGVKTLIHAPTRFTWSGPGGYMDRNLEIARTSDLVLVIVVKEFPPGFTGKRFPYCYHCKDRNPEHIKSGGCWTAWRCGNQRWRIV